MKYINTNTKAYPVSERDIRAMNPNTSFATPFLAPEEYALVFAAPAPDHDPIKEMVREIAPVLTEKGHYEQQWEVVVLDSEQVKANQLAKDTADAKIVNDKIEALWEAADKYTSGYISGVAVGILTIGVMQEKPKALAISAWSSSIWAEYYVRKYMITAGSEVSHDFSSFGPIPYSVPELQEEVGL